MSNYSSFAQVDRHLPTGLCSFAHLVESSSQCKTVSSSSESALPATGTHSQCQQEFPGSGFVTTCLSSQAHNAEGGLRWLSAPWGMEGDLCCVRGTVPTAHPNCVVCALSRGTNGTRTFCSIRQPYGKWMRSQGIPWKMRVLRKSHKLRINFRQLLLRFNHGPDWPHLWVPPMPSWPKTTTATLSCAPRPSLSYPVDTIIPTPVPWMAPSQCWMKPLLQTWFWPNFLL